MNRRQLQKLGVPPHAVPTAIASLSQAASEGLGFGLKGRRAHDQVKQVLERPTEFLQHPHWRPLANLLLAAPAEFAPREPIAYRTWGDDIDPAAHQQMRQACRLPSATHAALMPDAHVGYGLPIGGVLACDGAVVPYAVGVDIACRMKLSLLDLPVESLDRSFERYRDALERCTRFGVGCEHRPKQQHAVLDRDWTVTRVTREKKDVAWKQLGTSGSGNHFVEFGVVTLEAPLAEWSVAPGSYVALLSHSGSRGTGAAVCSTYSDLAARRLPAELAEFRYLAWLSLDSQEGQEYWAAMNLMGDYAAANHAVIHRLVAKHLGAEVLAGVENHHNFGWLEEHGGRQLVVHRKGATPAGVGVLGVIPGSMGSATYVVRGLGNAASLESASHGAGRCMSRRAAHDKFRFSSVQAELAERGIRVLSAGSDEVPGVYKDIEHVMAAQADLVEKVARFDPRIVKMCGDGSRAED